MKAVPDDKFGDLCGKFGSELVIDRRLNEDSVGANATKQSFSGIDG